MSFIDNLKELFWKFPTVQKKEEPKPVLEPVVEAAVEPAPPPPLKKELKKNDPEKPAQAKRVTGDDVTYWYHRSAPPQPHHQHKLRDGDSIDSDQFPVVWRE